MRENGEEKETIAVMIVTSATSRIGFFLKILLRTLRVHQMFALQKSAP